MESHSQDSHSQIEDEAAEWLARRDGDHWSEDDEAHLQQWIEASTARRIAYLRLKSTWDTAARLRALRAGPSPATSAEVGVPPPGEWRRTPFFGQPSTSRAPARVNPARPALRTYAIAATLVLAIAAGFGAFWIWSDRGDHYSTAIGGQATVPMSDGSKVTLNTATDIRVAITNRERRIDLEQGEAFFEVAHDKSRPFIVHAGAKRVIAVGTKFSVQHFGEAVRVLVTEGQVRVENSDSKLSLGGDPNDSGAVLLSAGDLARARQAAVVVQKSAPPQVEELLSWRAGYLRFHETPLADAVAEMNRYNTRKILIEESQLAAVKISGTFRPTQYDAFVRVLRDGFAIQARTEGEQIVLTQGR